MNRDSGPKRARPRSLSVLINLLLVFCVSVLGFLGSAAIAGHQLLTEEVFPQGTVIDGLTLGGLSLEQGREAILEKRGIDLENTLLQLNYAGNVLLLTAQEMGLSFDVDEVLNDAHYPAPPQNASPLLGFQALFSPKEPLQRQTAPKYDKAVILRSLRNILLPYDLEPINASAIFHKELEKFTYMPDCSSRYANLDKTADLVIQRLQTGDDSVVLVPYDIVSAEVSTKELRKNTALISQYSTEVGSNAERNTNIRKACELLDGSAVAPGATLSLNGILGERTEEKGFRSAPVLMDGNTVDDIGGGICQVAGTIYNAALLANMEVVERVRHTYPAQYLPVGLDATLNWDDKDLKLKNNSNHSLYLSVKFDQASDQLTVKVYGQPLESGLRIELVPEVVKEVQPRGRSIEYTTALAPGIEKLLASAQLGYEVKVYRNFYFDGELIKHELLSHDSYAARPATVQVGASAGSKP
ncbi:MAG: VanW family protein [Christensenellaceae bacterium]|jgi:vancomycin resistance protein YoaR|nr:VanW family protein [Christensenellaceae bacterium]